MQRYFLKLSNSTAIYFRLEFLINKLSYTAM
jgi:hypothetical protein